MIDIFLQDRFVWTWWIEIAMAAAPNEMPCAVIADLENVKYLALRHRMWDLLLHAIVKTQSSFEKVFSRDAWMQNSSKIALS
jgi:hypothetical protein